MELHERIQQLEKDLIEYTRILKELEVASIEFKNKSEGDISKKDQELHDLKIKLKACQKVKDEIVNDLDAKIEEIKNSNLSNEEKSKQIVNLVLEDREVTSSVYSELASA